METQVLVVGEVQVEVVIVNPVPALQVVMEEMDLPVVEEEAQNLIKLTQQVAQVEMVLVHLDNQIKTKLVEKVEIHFLVMLRVAVELIRPMIQVQAVEAEPDLVLVLVVKEDSMTISLHVLLKKVVVVVPEHVIVMIILQEVEVLVQLERQALQVVLREVRQGW